MNITHGIQIGASAERLYHALTTREGIGGWYTPETKAESKVGGIVECAFGDYGALKFRVDQLEPNRRVAWTVVQGPPEWMDTRITFEIVEDEGQVEFEFRHSGLPEQYDAYSNFNYLWGQYVRSIKLYAETGAGERSGRPGRKPRGRRPDATVHADRRRRRSR